MIRFLTLIILLTISLCSNAGYSVFSKGGVVLISSDKPIDVDLITVLYSNGEKLLLSKKKNISYEEKNNRLLIRVGSYEPKAISIILNDGVGKISIGI